MDQYSSKPILIIVCGPSGSGKKTLIDHVLKTCPEIERVPTYTTRLPREGEVPDVDYVYITQEVFNNYLETGEIFECTRTYGDYYYGSPRKLLEPDDGKNIITELDYKGMFRVRSSSKRNVISIFIVPPLLKDLSKRIKKRADEKNIDNRLNIVAEQMQYALAFDYVLFNIDKFVFLEEAACIIKSELIKKNGFGRLINDRHDYDTTLHNK